MSHKYLILGIIVIVAMAGAMIFSSQIGQNQEAIIYPSDNSNQASTNSSTLGHASQEQLPVSTDLDDLSDELEDMDFSDLDFELSDIRAEQAGL